MAEQAINTLPKKTTALDTDAVLMIGTSEEYQIDYGKLADAILNKLTSKTFALDQGTKSLVAALNELNSNAFKTSNIVRDILELDEMAKTQISYVSGAQINRKTVYGFAFTVAYDSIMSQLVFGSFDGVSSIAVRGKSGSPVQWKDWKIL